jgi:hypothetical protein
MMLVAAGVAVRAEARTVRGALADAQEVVGIRPSPALTALADRIAVEATTALMGPSGALAAAGQTPDPATGLGPIFLPSAQTLGHGTVSVNLVGSPTDLDQLDGESVDALGPGPGLTLLRRTATGRPAQPILLGVQLQYELALHIAAVALALGYGLTDDLDVHLTIPLVHSRLDATVGLTAVAQVGPRGTLLAIPGTPTRVKRVRPVEATGLGDMVLRLTYGLPTPPPFFTAFSLEWQVPSGEHDNLHGTGDFWLIPTFNAAYLVGPVELAASVALDFDLSQSTRSQALYGMSVSAVLYPKRVIGVVEFLGRSQLDAVFDPDEEAVLTLLDGRFTKRQVLGLIPPERHDYFDLAFGIRVLLGHGMVGFVNGLVALNDAGFRPTGVTPTVGIGVTF